MELTEVYEDSAISLSAIEYRVAEFKRGRASMLDEDRPGRPKEVPTSRMIEKNPRFSDKLSEIASA